jgi:tetratricopeptide (TPR) repeat protein
MKISAKYLFVLFVVFFSFVVQAKSLKIYIEEAKALQNSGKVEEAAKLMEKASDEYPDSASAYAYLGLYTGMQAGQTQNMVQAGELAAKSFELLDKAVSLDSLNLISRLHRGIMGIKAPTFFGKLETGIKDHEFIIKVHQKSPKKVSGEMLVQVYNFLGEGYQKQGENEKAVSAWNKVLELAPNSVFAEEAKKQIKTTPISDSKPSKEKIKEETKDAKSLMKEGKSYLEKENCEEAVNVFKKLVEIDSKNAEVYKYLAQALGCLAEKGYNEKIYDNTNYLADLAFSAMDALDKAIALAPEDHKLRLTRGSVGVYMPFFLGKLDQSIEDLNKIIESDAESSTKAEAMYHLGIAYQRKALDYWDKVVTDYPSSDASKMVFESMRPGIKRIDPDKFKNATVVVDFVLGFQDALAPQTAVWIEDKKGNFIKTLYVSGFSGYVKEKQLWLKKWAESSKYVDTDAITSASIDAGHHIYLWELKDHTGKKVKSGEYVVKVEVSSWPSMKYQLESVPIKIDGKKNKSTVEEGNIIPFLEATYYPKK